MPCCRNDNNRSNTWQGQLLRGRGVWTLRCLVLFMLGLSWTVVLEKEAVAKEAVAKAEEARGHSASSKAATRRGVSVPARRRSVSASNTTSASKPGSVRQRGRRRGRDLPENRYEWGLVPAFSASSDKGFGFGVVGILVRFRRGYFPYRWRAKINLATSIKPGPQGVDFPQHNYGINLDFPGLLGQRLRLRTRVGFSRLSTEGYFGLGNASELIRSWEGKTPGTEAYVRAKRRYQYIRTFPYGDLFLRYRFSEEWFFFTGIALTYNWLDFYPGSLLQEDIRRAARGAYPVLYGTDPHGVAEFHLGLVWDRRDSEIAPQSGWFHEVSLRGAPGGLWGNRLDYGGLNLTLRFYQALAGPYLVFALRLLADLLVGNVPFYKLASYGGLYPEGGPGGGYGVRGIQKGRYHGKVKLLANVELRSKLVPFRLFGVRFNLGAVLFADAGRIWSDYWAGSSLDGRGAGLKVGLGGGLRVQWGQAFVARGDFAWSPDAAQANPSFPVGYYVELGHVF